MTDFECRCTDDEVAGFFKTLSNWGRWGPDDELGTLNFITPEVVRSAAALVRSGRSVSLAHDIATRPAPNNPRPAVHIMQLMDPGVPGSTDFLGIACHGFATTHIDALCHEFQNGSFYNGFRVDQTLYMTGARHCSVHLMRDGIVSRGVLLDIPRAVGKNWLDVGERVHVEDLELAEEMAGTKVRSGDVVLIRVGQYARMAVEGLEAPFSRDFLRNGIDADCLPWFHEREVSIYGGDCIERMPSGYPSVRMPLHMIGVTAMGMPLLDNVAVEELAGLCQEQNRWEFMLTFAPLRLRGGTGSAVNPIAVF